MNLAPPSPLSREHLATHVGIDVVDLPGFRAQLEDPASRFATHTFTEAERTAAALRPGADPARHLAARFAAKEAFLKAWDGAYWGRRPPLEAPVDLREIEVVSDPWGRPTLAFHGRVADHLPRTLMTSVSLSHDGPVAVAVVQLAFSTGHSGQPEDRS